MLSDLQGSFEEDRCTVHKGGKPDAEHVSASSDALPGLERFTANADTFRLKFTGQRVWINPATGLL